MADLNIIRTISTELENIDIIDGQLIFVIDTYDIYLDVKTQRIKYKTNQSTISSLKAGNGISLSTDESGVVTITNTGVTVERKDSYWWIDNTNTGVKAEGTDGITPTITIDDTTKEWVINDSPTGVLATVDGITQSDYLSIINLLTEINRGLRTALEGDI